MLESNAILSPDFRVKGRYASVCKVKVPVNTKRNSCPGCFLQGAFSSRVRVRIVARTYSRSCPARSLLNNCQCASSASNVAPFLAHAGQSYSANSADAIRRIDKNARSILASVRDRHRDSFEELDISLGDTPSCSVVEDFRGVDELRPGNLVFYDLMQFVSGVCRLQDIALAMACPVIAHHGDKLIIHGGSAHFSKDSIRDKDGDECFGWVVAQKTADIASGWSTADTSLRLTSLSQEHGTVTGPREQLDRYDIGDYVLVLPVHSCLTGCSMKSYRTLTGEYLDHL